MRYVWKARILVPFFPPPQIVLARVPFFTELKKKTEVLLVQLRCKQPQLKPKP